MSDRERDRDLFDDSDEETPEERRRRADREFTERQRVENEARQHLQILQQTLAAREGDDASVQATIGRVSASGEELKKLIEEQMKKVRKLQWDAFASELNLLSHRAVMQEFDKVSQYLLRSNVRVSGPNSQSSDFLRNAFQNAVTALQPLANVPDDACAYESIVALMGVDQYEQYKKRTYAVRVAAETLFEVCNPLDRVLFGASPGLLRLIPGVKDVWYNLTQAHLAEFLGHMHPRCDGDDGSVKVDAKAAEKEFYTRLYKKLDDDMTLPGHGVHSDLRGRAALGLFLELCENVLYGHSRAAFASLSSGMPTVGGKPLLRPGKTTARSTGRHFLEQYDGRLAAEFATLLHRIFLEPELSNPRLFDTYYRNTNERMVATPNIPTVGGGVTPSVNFPSQAETNRGISAETIAKRYVQRVVYVLCSKSDFLRQPVAVLCFVNLWRATEQPVFFKRETRLQKGDASYIKETARDPKWPLFSMMATYRMHILGIGNGEASQVHTSILETYWRRTNSGSVIPQRNALLSRSNTKLFEWSTRASQGIEWLRQHPFETSLYGTVMMAGMFLYFPSNRNRLARVVYNASKWATRKPPLNQTVLQKAEAECAGGRRVSCGAAVVLRMWDATSPVTQEGVMQVVENSVKTITPTFVGPVFEYLVATAVPVGAAASAAAFVIRTQQAKGSTTRKLLNRGYRWLGEEKLGWEPSFCSSLETIPEVEMKGVEPSTVPLPVGEETGGVFDGSLYNGDTLDMEDVEVHIHGGEILSTLTLQDMMGAILLPERDNDADAYSASTQSLGGIVADEMLAFGLGALMNWKEDLEKGKLPQVTLNPQTPEGQELLLQIANPLGIGAQTEALKQSSPSGWLRSLNVFVPVLAVDLSKAGPSSDPKDEYDSEAPTPMEGDDPLPGKRREALEEDPSKDRMVGKAVGTADANLLAVRLANVLDIVAPLPKGVR